MFSVKRRYVFKKDGYLCDAQFRYTKMNPLSECNP